MKDKFRSQFAVLCFVGILATSAAAAASAPMLFGRAIQAPATNAPTVQYSWWDVVCKVNLWDWSFCPKPIKEVIPNEPTPTCDPNTQSCPS